MDEEQAERLIEALDKNTSAVKSLSIEIDHLYRLIQKGGILDDRLYKIEEAINNLSANI